MKLGVLAGTPVDTRMGMDAARKAGFDCVGRYCSETPERQTYMQALEAGALFELAVSLCLEMTGLGASGILLYCNSLAGALDMAELRRRVPVKIVTPLDVYAELARRYKSVAVLAANGQSLAAIERTFQAANPACAIYGCGLLPLVNAIEEGLPPREIMEKLDVAGLVKSLCGMGCEILLLGCTHFPYIGEQVRNLSSVPVIDPAGDMLAGLSPAPTEHDR